MVHAQLFQRRRSDAHQDSVAFTCSQMSRLLLPACASVTSWQALLAGSVAMGKVRQGSVSVNPVSHMKSGRFTRPHL